MPRPSSSRMRRTSLSAPEGPTVEATIEHLGHRGDGIARLDDGRTLFVAGTAPGDRVRVRLGPSRADGVSGRLEEVLAPGASRVEPSCPHFARCGGCSLQHLEDGAYAAWKATLPARALERQGFVEPPVAGLIRRAPGNRRRASFSFRCEGQRALVGFSGRGSHAVVDLEQCGLLTPSLVSLLPALRKLLTEGLAPSRRLTGALQVTWTESGPDVLIRAAASPGTAVRERLVRLTEAADLARLAWNSSDTEEPEPLLVRRVPVVTLGGVPVALPMDAFLQPDVAGEATIASAVVAAVAGQGPVLDLFAGCGSFTFPLAKSGAAVHAVEGRAAQVEALRAAAGRAGLAVSAETRDLARRPLTANQVRRFGAVVLDPPRAGAAEQCRVLAASGPALVVMVSCEPTTLARDLRILVDGGYALESVAPIDQFPWSHHLESVAVLRRQGSRARRTPML